MTRFQGLVLAILLGIAGPAVGQTQAACEGDGYRAFDFWLGEWTVSNPAGQPVGSNSITSVADGCAVLESWAGAGGVHGTSLNWHDQRTGGWTQLWVGGDGVILRLEGGLDGEGSMVLSGERTAADGRVVRERVRWTPLQGGRVRQHWETSTDGGDTWQTSFDGIYTKASSET
jgi:hypothetical protein